MNYENLDESSLKSIVHDMDSQQLLKILNQTLYNKLIRNK